MNSPPDWEGEDKVAGSATIAREPAAIDTTSTSTSASVAWLEKALKNIPFPEKEAYLIAFKEAPRLVQLESNPELFLQREDGDGYAAAVRLSLYWTTRKDTFGERAYLPMTITGEGAMDAFDIEVVRSGFFAPLPDAAEGVQVFCFHRSRLNGKRSVSIQSRKRCFFYFCQVMAENPISRSEGSIGLRVMEDATFSNSIPTLEFLRNGSVARLKNLYVCAYLPKSGKKLFTETVLPVLMQKLNGCMGKIVSLLAKESAGEFAAELEGAGVSKEGLPAILGGTCDYSQLEAWLDKRVVLERSREGLGVVTATPMVLSAPDLGKVVPASKSEEVSCKSSAVKKRVQASSTKEGESEFLKQPPLKKRLVGDYEVARMVLREEQVIEPPLTQVCAQVYSNTKAVPASDQDRRAAFMAALERIPYEDKAAYLEAQERVPALVEKESGQEAFLSCENFNVEAAAGRLATYWEKRKAIFGESAFLPMTQTGEGALNRGDLTVLASCYFAPLPTDRGGRSVFCYDASKLGKCALDSRLRVTFYLLAVAAENKTSRNDGCVVLCIKGQQKSDRDKKDTLGPIIDALPVRIKALHVICREAGHRKNISAKKIGLAVSQLFGNSLESRTITHNALCREEIVRQLDAYGLSKVGLPKSLGGDWGYQKLTQWQELRSRLEWGLPPGSSGEEVDQMFNFASIRKLSDLTEEEKVERKRRLNVIHSRRKRERERIEIEVLQEHCSELGEKNKYLEDENKRFEEILASAQSKIALLEPSASSSKPLCAAPALFSASSPMGAPRAAHFPFPSLHKVPAAAAAAATEMPAKRWDTYDKNDEQPVPSILEELYSEQSLRDQMAAQAARGQDTQGIELKRELECQRAINARSSFMSGGAATGEISSHRDHRASQSIRTEEMQEIEFRRESQLRQEPDAQCSFLGGDRQSLRDHFAAQATREAEMEAIQLQREIQRQRERNAQSSLMGNGAATSERQSHRDYMAAQAASAEEMETIQLQREIQLQRARNAQSSFMGGGTATTTSETQLRRDYMTNQAERAQEIQAMHLQRQIQLQREPDAQSSFSGGGAPTSEIERLRDLLAARAACSEERQGMDLERECHLPREPHAQCSFLGSGAATSLDSIQSIRNSFLLNDMLRRQGMQGSFGGLEQDYSRQGEESLQQLQYHQHEQQLQQQLQQQQYYGLQLQQLQQHPSYRTAAPDNVHVHKDGNFTASAVAAPRGAASRSYNGPANGDYNYDYDYDASGRY
jgi:hypothetical protein